MYYNLICIQIHLVEKQCFIWLIIVRTCDRSTYVNKLICNNNIKKRRVYSMCTGCKTTVNNVNKTLPG